MLFTLKRLGILWLFIGMLIGCKKFIAVDAPSTQIASAAVFTSDNTATTAMLGVYSQMAGAGNFIRGGNQGFSFLAGLSADELTNYSTYQFQKEIYNNAISTHNSLAGICWAEPYSYIYTANSILEGLAASSGVSSGVQKKLGGEAHFIRAFNYFYLVNIFGDVPLVLSSAYGPNAALPRSTVSQVYDQVTSDLVAALALLPEDYGDYNNDRIRPCRPAAAALLARVYLYTGQYAKAEATATTVINNPLFELQGDLNNVFLANSPEAIWQLEPNVSGYNTQDGYFFIVTAYPDNAVLSTSLLGSFETGDQRKQQWTGSFDDGTQTFYFPYKYKVKTGSNVSEYAMILRLAEQYLIRAEARAQQDNISGSQDDINSIRKRAGLPAILAIDKAAMLHAIEHERQIELFSEWGHRWLDLKRTGRADAVLGILKAPNWQATDGLYPIPVSEIALDPQLRQNPGY